jgi:hypothetical protein
MKVLGGTLQDDTRHGRPWFEVSPVARMSRSATAARHSMT